MTSESHGTIPPACPHGLRPGTTVCLHCRHDARVAATQQRYRMAARIGLLSIGGAVVAALVVSGLTAIAPDARSFGRSVAQTVASAVPRPSLSTKSRATTAAAIEPIIPEG